MFKEIASWIAGGIIGLVLVTITKDPLISIVIAILVVLDFSSIKKHHKKDV